jgi:hypothetical protein
MLEKTPYFKPTKRLHDTGFRLIEYGYCSIDKKCNAIDIEVLDEYDIIIGRDRIEHLDVTRNGYIRILSPILKWNKFMNGRLDSCETKV